MKYVGLKQNMFNALNIVNSLGMGSGGGAEFFCEGVINLYGGTVPQSLDDIPFFNSSQSSGLNGSRYRAVEENSLGIIPYKGTINNSDPTKSVLTINNVTGLTQVGKQLNLMTYSEPTENGNAYMPSVWGGALSSLVPSGNDILIHKPVRFIAPNGAAASADSDYHYGVSQTAGYAAWSPTPWAADDPSYGIYMGYKGFADAKSARQQTFHYREPVTVNRFIFRFPPISGWTNGIGGGALPLRMDLYYLDEATSTWKIAGGAALSYSTGSSGQYAFIPLATPITAKHWYLYSIPNTNASSGNGTNIYLSEIGLGLAGARTEQLLTPTWALVCPYVNGFDARVSDKTGKMAKFVQDGPVMLVEIGTGPGQLNLNKTTFSNLLHDKPSLATPLTLSLS